MYFAAFAALSVALFEVATEEFTLINSTPITQSIPFVVAGIARK